MFRPLIDVDTLATLLRVAEDDTRPPEASAVVVDCRFSLADPLQGSREYAAGHLPGAVYAHLDDDLSSVVIPGVTGRHPLPDATALGHTLSRLGIGPETVVIAYDGGPGAFAARLWWLLRWVGHEAVAVLDGGFAAWTGAGYAIEEVAARPESRPDPYPVRPDATRVAQADEALENIRAGSGILVDAREHVRYLGHEEPIDPVAGRIPGAVSAPWPENVAGGRWRAPGELRERYASLLGTGDAGDIVVYCGSGVTAAHDILAIELAGLGRARLYPGSWSEWITDPARPIARD